MAAARDRLKRALFLDRDGVINRDKGYVGRREDFIWREGIFDLVGAARRLGYLPVVVTNQSGIARGFYTEAAYHELTNWMLDIFKARNTPLEKVYFCPYHPVAKIESYRADHPWRKPGPGMLLAARDELGLDLANSVMVGDQWRDGEAAHRAGLRHIVIVGQPEGLAPGHFNFVQVADLLEVKAWLENQDTF